MSPAQRRSRVVAALLGLGLYAWITVAHHRAAPDAGADSATSWIIGPSAPALERAADAAAERGVARLEDARVPARERLDAYAAELQSARELLLRSLRAQPTRASALARLAAVRWELATPQDPAAVGELLRMVELATRAAPGVSRVQRTAGELLLDMGRPAEASAALRRALELDPPATGAVVARLRSRRLGAERLLELLGPSAPVTAALRDVYWEQGKERLYLATLETSIALTAGEPLAPLIRAYGGTCLRLVDPTRLLRFTEGLGELSDPQSEAERLRWCARARLELGQPASALADALAARRHRPDSAGLAELAGRARLEAGQPAEAISAFREALALLAHGKVEPPRRARLYSAIGRAEERRGDALRAYDAYRMALRLDPREPHARSRMRAMEQAAGQR